MSASAYYRRDEIEYLTPEDLMPRYTTPSYPTPASMLYPTPDYQMPANSTLYQMPGCFDYNTAEQSGQGLTSQQELWEAGACLKYDDPGYESEIAPVNVRARAAGLSVPTGEARVVKPGSPLPIGSQARTRQEGPAAPKNSDPVRAKAMPPPVVSGPASGSGSGAGNPPPKRLARLSAWTDPPPLPPPTQAGLPPGLPPPGVPKCPYLAHSKIVAPVSKKVRDQEKDRKEEEEMRSRSVIEKARKIEEDATEALKLRDFGRQEAQRVRVHREARQRRPGKEKEKEIERIREKERKVQEQLGPLGTEFEKLLWAGCKRDAEVEVEAVGKALEGLKVREKEKIRPQETQKQVEAEEDWEVVEGPDVGCVMVDECVDSDDSDTWC